jgi:hypothetical protein
MRPHRHITGFAATTEITVPTARPTVACEPQYPPEQNDKLGIATAEQTTGRLNPNYCRIYRTQKTIYGCINFLSLRVKLLEFMLDHLASTSLK